MNRNVVPAVLIIRDGWGVNHNREEDFCNAVARANIPFSDWLSDNCPRTEILASGHAVGVPDGVMGNSEVGHQNIGAGRVVDQEIVRIDKAMSSGEFEKNQEFRLVVENAKRNSSKIHLIGLCSDGGVHSAMRHLFNILKFLKNENVRDVFVHFISDGRDTPKNSGLVYLKDIEEKFREVGIGEIATVVGRFWAMDRDGRWNRVERAYNCMVGMSGFDKYESPARAIGDYYKNPAAGNQEGDEFIPPAQIIDDNEVFRGKIEDGDSVIFFNFRGDRPREIIRAFTQRSFSGFKREKLLKLFFCTLTEYEVGLCEHVIFRRPPKMKNILGEYINNLGLRQFRCAETEKYAHVTFFFNDYRDQPFSLEDRKLIPSPSDIETYDQRPEMSAFEVKDAVKCAIFSKKYDLIVVNFANPDMVGHTGNFDAGKIAAETVDACLRDLLSAVDSVGSNAIITADHGNLEKMADVGTKLPFTQHTTNPVEVILYGENVRSSKLRDGGALCDIAPTILKMMNIDQPPEMTGKPLF